MAPQTINSPQTRITRMGSIVRSLRRLGFEIPADVEAELKIIESQSTAAGDAATALRVARNNLDSVPAAKFDSALAEFDKAAIRAFAAQNGDAEIIRNVTATRLESAIVRHYGDWMEQITNEYNAVVDSHDLNKHSRNLPDFGGILRVLDLSSAHTAAIEAWKAAEPTLSSYWGMYVRLAELNGHERIGPQTVDSSGTNMWFACVLGEANRSQAQQAAVVMASIAAGSTASAEVRTLSPHVIPAIVGYDLNLTTPEKATHRRNRHQPIAINFTSPQHAMSY